MCHRIESALHLGEQSYKMYRKLVSWVLSGVPALQPGRLLNVHK